MAKNRRAYLPRIVGSKVMMPADLKRLHKYMREVEHIGIVSDEMREAVEELWPELAHKLRAKRSRS
jgi:N-glycosylase/DNA lyase